MFKLKNKKKTIYLGQINIKHEHKDHAIQYVNTVLV